MPQKNKPGNPEWGASKQQNSEQCRVGDAESTILQTSGLAQGES